MTGGTPQAAGSPLVVGSVGGLAAAIDPDNGGRILSLTSGPAHERFEWLAVGTDAPDPTRGIPFVRDGMGGWDEVVPSVAPVTLATGVGIPDHGDAWNTPWEVVRALSATPGLLASLTLEITLASVPVTIRRTIAASGAGLVLEYVASTTSEVPIPLLWSAHPQFRAEPGSTVSVAVGGVPLRPALVEEYPERGVARSWELVANTGLPPRGVSRKVFVDRGIHTAMPAVDSATLSHPTGEALTLAWNPAELPHLGLFWDNAEFAGGAIIAIEPSTGRGDSLLDADAAGRVLRVARAAPLSWSLRVVAT